MGVRGILRILLEGMGTSAQRLVDPKKRSFVVSRMYIDMIQFVYKAMNAIKADALQANIPAKLDDDSIIQRTVQMLMSFVQEISPRAFLGIYFDGIPPLAKVVEQRARRYEMEEPGAGFNRAKITVGTAFVRKVVEGVLAGLADNASLLPPEVEVSTPAEPGEGEHKLATRIRDRDASLPGSKIIVADDGDVMVMALLNAWRDCHVYLDHPGQDGKPGKHGLLSIGALAERVRERLGDTPTAVFDFCLMVILTGGNDFMPTIQAARDRNDILTQLMDMYGPILRGQPLMTNQGREIVWSSVRALVTQLATNEERNIRHAAATAKKKLNGRMPALFTQSMDPQTGEIKLPYFRKAWDNELYTSKVTDLPEGIIIPKPTPREIEADHAFSATQYLQGLSWTLGYMRTGDGPDWFYNSAFPPLFGDLARILSTGVDPVRSMRSLPGWQPQPLAVYLLTVLPRATAEELFGETFVNAFSFGAGIVDLFPLKFQHFAPAEWDKTMKGRAILPPLGLDRIAKVVEERLNTEVIERNYRAVLPRVRFSRSQGVWVPVGQSAPKEEKRRTKCTGQTADYEVLEPVISTH